MSWHERFKAMKSGLGLTNSDIADITGNSADSVKSVTQPNKEIPRWLKLAIVVYERMKTKKQIKERIEKLEAKVKEYEETTKYEDFVESIKEEILTFRH